MLTLIHRAAPWLRLLPLLLLVGCTTIAPFDQEAYKTATALKVDTLVVMSKATESYARHQREIAALQIALDKAYEYDRNRPLNEITIQMWDKLRNPQGALLGGFLQEWKEDGPLLPTYVQRKKTQISEGFDNVIQLESGKMKPAEAARKL
jgi:hypothetical protein